MGQSQIELLQEIYDLWGRGDYTRGDFLHPDFELSYAGGFLDEGVFRGPREAWLGWKQWQDQWSSWRYESTRFVELDDGRIAVFIDIHGVSRSTGLELSSESGNVWDFEDGLVRRLALYAHRDDMVRDLGLDGDQS
jgi:ketosteroid isomerase-like protein